MNIPVPTFTLSATEREKALDLLVRFVETPSPYFQEKAIMDETLQLTKELGFPGQLSSYHFAPLGYDGLNLHGELVGSADGPTLYLGGHLDTVNVATGWTRPPLKATQEGDLLYGTGVLDMKAGCSAIIMALNLFKANHPNHKGTIAYHFASCEEGPYGLGTTFYLKNVLTKKPDFAIIAEPSSALGETDELTVCLGAMGGYNYKVILQGASAHAATPEQGLSAVDEGAKLVQALNRIEGLNHEVMGRAASCVIAFHGGSGACSVPDMAEIEVFRHCVPGETKATIEQEVQQTIDRLNLKCQTTIVFRDEPADGFDGGFAPYYIHANHPMVKSLEELIVKRQGKSPRYTYSKAIGDFNLMGGQRGIDTILFGPSGNNIHQADEYVSLESYYTTIEILYEFLIKHHT